MPTLPGGQQSTVFSTLLPAGAVLDILAQWMGIPDSKVSVDHEIRERHPCGLGEALALRTQWRKHGPFAGSCPSA